MSDKLKARVKYLERMTERAMWILNYKNAEEGYPMLKEHFKKYEEQ